MPTVARTWTDDQTATLRESLMHIVELAPAYVWDCGQCGRENFQRAVSMRLDPNDPGDAEMIREIHDIDPDKPIPDIIAMSWQTRPERVTCKHCGTEFVAADSGGDGDEDDEAEE